LVFAAGVQFKTLAFGNELHRILVAVKCFGSHCSCHPQGEYVLVGLIWLAHVHRMDRALNVMELAGGADQKASIQ
jgi:hypothetical protein